MLDTYSFEQLGAQARCVIMSRVKLLNLLLSPLVGDKKPDGEGTEWKPHRVADGPAKAKKRDRGTFRSKDIADPAKREAALLAALGGSMATHFTGRQPGHVRTANTSGKGTPEGGGGTTG